MANFFYFLTFLALLSALMVIFTRNPIHSVLYLILTFFAIVGHYILLNAQFLAIVHLIVYLGAIMVLFLFSIMFLNINKLTEPQRSVYAKTIGVITGGLLLVVLVGTFKGTMLTVNEEPETQIGLIQTLGQVLYTEFLVPFEIASLLFLAAMIGAVVLAKKKVKES